jgi:anaerobic ribonucleoside-triphosphate reductase activating protein
MYGVDALVRTATATLGIEGVTISGGEPLEQPEAVASFASGVRSAGLGVAMLTGFTRSEIEADPRLTEAVADVDAVIAGRYNRRKHVGAGLRGSANKEYWLRSDRYSAAMFVAVPAGELIIGPDGTTVVTGMLPIRLGSLS